MEERNQRKKMSSKKENISLKLREYIWEYYYWLSVASCSSCLIRLQGSLIINISERNPSNLLGFLHGDSHQVMVASVTTFFVWVCQSCLLSNQNAGFFNYQNLCKQWSGILVFCMELSREGSIWNCHFWLAVAYCLSSNQIERIFG